VGFEQGADLIPDMGLVVHDEYPLRHAVNSHGGIPLAHGQPIGGDGRGVDDLDQVRPETPTDA
jgi:hypothetical protein